MVIGLGVVIGCGYGFRCGNRMWLCVLMFIGVAIYYCQGYRCGDMMCL